jgi:uncharacterized protein (DUF2062 family)
MALGILTLWKKTKDVFVKELRANTSPMKASLSLALGILVGFSPFYGIHTIIILPLAFLLKLNRPLALLAVNTTILPLVPLWLAAGIFVGKIVVPVETASGVIEFIRNALPNGSFDGAVANAVGFSKRLLPSTVFDRIDEEGGDGIIDGFVQWMIGSSVLAVVCAVLTFAVGYFILLRRQAARRNKSEAKNEGTAA